MDVDVQCDLILLPVDQDVWSVVQLVEYWSTPWFGMSSREALVIECSALLNECCADDLRHRVVPEVMCGCVEPLATNYMLKCYSS